MPVLIVLVLLSLGMFGLWRIGRFFRRGMNGRLLWRIGLLRDCVVWRRYDTGYRNPKYK